VTECVAINHRRVEAEPVPDSGVHFSVSSASVLVYERGATLSTYDGIV
jgi:hypothetical protein